MKPIKNQTAQFIAVCENIASGDSIAEACRAAGVAARSFFKGLAADGDGPLGQAYTRARRYRADMRASEIEEFVRRATLSKDHPEYLEPNAARVAIDSHKWLASKENQSRFGDRVAVELPETKPGLSRADALAALQSGSIDVSEVLAHWTKPVQAIEAESTAETSPAIADDLEP